MLNAVKMIRGIYDGCARPELHEDTLAISPIVNLYLSSAASSSYKTYQIYSVQIRLNY